MSRVGLWEVRRCLDLIASHPNLSHFNGPIDEDALVAAEAALGVEFPPSYREFVRAVGAGDIAGEEFYGLVSGSRSHRVPDVMWVVPKARAEFGLPNPIIVCGADGMGGFYVMDTDKRGSTGEAPVEIWVPGQSQDAMCLEVVASDFGSLALELVQGAVSNQGGA